MLFWLIMPTSIILATSQTLIIYKKQKSKIWPFKFAALSHSFSGLCWSPSLDSWLLSSWGWPHFFLPWLIVPATKVSSGYWRGVWIYRCTPRGDAYVPLVVLSLRIKPYIVQIGLLSVCGKMSALFLVSDLTRLTSLICGLVELGVESKGFMIVLRNLKPIS